MSHFYIGVDVGTGSARAGVFDSKGSLLGSAKREIVLFNDEPGYYEQSGDQIWEAVCECVRESLSLSGVSASNVSGIGFDATCSLVVVGDDGHGLPVGRHGDSARNVILWMDHRAKSEAAEINQGKHEVLQFVGGTISPEMETPKLLWLKRNLPEIYHNAAYFFDLTDYLTWRATGSNDRSSCTTTCKWTYLAHDSRWDTEYFDAIELSELVKDGFRRIGSTVREPGSPLGFGLTSQAAADLGLKQGTAVPAGLIDAHAGGIGTVGARSADNCDVTNTMAYVFGTSACTMTTTKDRAFVPGVWGPYYNAMVPGYWLLEAGQSAAGVAIDQLMKHSPIYDEVKQLAAKEGLGLNQWLSNLVKSKVGENLSKAAELVGRVKVVPEFMGNRAPLADPNRTAVIAGLTMDESLDGICSLYVAGILGIGYGLKQILTAQKQSGVAINQIVISGGAGQDPLVRQLIADATLRRVVAPRSEEPVLLGAAITAHMASNLDKHPSDVMAEMSGFSSAYEPATGEIRSIHERGYRSFLALQSVQ